MSLGSFSNTHSATQLVRQNCGAVPSGRTSHSLAAKVQPPALLTPTKKEPPPLWFQPGTASPTEMLLEGALSSPSTGNSRRCSSSCLSTTRENPDDTTYPSLLTLNEDSLLNASSFLDENSVVSLMRSSQSIKDTFEEYHSNQATLIIEQLNDYYAQYLKIKTASSQNRGLLKSKFPQQKIDYTHLCDPPVEDVYIFNVAHKKNLQELLLALLLLPPLYPSQDKSKLQLLLKPDVLKFIQQVFYEYSRYPMGYPPVPNTNNADMQDGRTAESYFVAFFVGDYLKYDDITNFRYLLWIVQKFQRFDIYSKIMALSRPNKQPFLTEEFIKNLYAQLSDMTKINFRNFFIKKYNYEPNFLKTSIPSEKLGERAKKLKIPQTKCVIL